MISIIVVNYNGKKWLKKCFDSLNNQTYKDFEIVFVDNASNDDSIQFVKDNYPQVCVVQSHTNLGFAGGNNLGIHSAHGSLILLLNNDTWLEPEFLEQYLTLYHQNHYDILGVTEKKYDGGDGIIGIVPKIDLFGHPTYVKSKSKVNIADDLFYTSGVCCLFTKELYLKTGGLDEDFFMYFEEIDWTWRCRLYGHTVGQANNLYVYHKGAGSTGKGVKYNSFLWRNQNCLQMLIKNYKWYNLIWSLPIYFLFNIIEIVFFLVMFRRDIVSTYWKGWVYNIRMLPRTLYKRKKIQENRIVGDRLIIKHMYQGAGKLIHLMTFYMK